jgi:2-desacetyl-2-hydroxyethyl bacteriochlorophyllide A dehydrogenase
MRAAVLTELPAEGFSLQSEFPDPDPAENAVVIEVDACGICGTDLEILRGRSYDPELPFVLGHEPVGRVVEVGPGAEPELLGSRVTLTIFVGREETCEVCLEHPERKTPCRVGDERLCHGGAEVIGVLGRRGGFAERLEVPARLLVEVPEGLDDSVAASLVDAGATAANAVRQAVQDDPRPVAVFGAGPLGFFAAQLLPHPPLVVEPNPRRRAAAAALGFWTSASAEEIGVELGAVVDCSGAPGLLDRGLELLGAHGRYVVAGYGPVETSTAPLARKELRIVGVRSGRREDLETVLAAVAAGTLRAPEIETWPLARIDDAFAALRAGEVAGKAVITIRDDDEEIR